MVIFLTLFVGVISGAPVVRVAVTPPVTVVDLRLDGERKAILTAPDWGANLSLGDELGPFVLEAVAYDRNGREIGRDRQLLNLGQRRANARIVPRVDRSGRVTAAHLIWEAPAFPNRPRVTARLDGKKVRVPRSSTVDLQRVAGPAVHVLDVELAFRRGVKLRRSLLFGEGDLRATSSELTAIPAVFEKKKVPSAAALQGWFAADGKEVRVDSVENGPSTVVVVRDLGVSERVHRVFTGASATGAVSNRFGFAHLGRADHVTFVEVVPRSSVASDGEAVPFPVSKPSITASQPSLAKLLWRAPLLEGDRRRVADAVAVAGITAARGRQRRAVVLCLGGAPDDWSFRSVEAVRRYLAALRVPLVVWDFREERQLPAGRETPWGETTVIDSAHAFIGAAKRLRSQLAGQRIIWIEGEYLPGAVSLTSAARGIWLAG